MSKPKYYFTDRESLSRLIDDYFERSKNDTDKPAQPITVTGLALHLGFYSKEQFDSYLQGGRERVTLRRGCFKVLAYYESRLHYPAPTGAMFALKSMGWSDKPKVPKTPKQPQSLKVKLIETGPQPASAEKDVAL